jgi:DNA helicase-2/ATP-dependent DNA helicase PcrA
MLFYDALKKVHSIETLKTAAKAKITAFIDMLEGLKKDMQAEVSPLVEKVFASSGLETSLRQIGDKDAIDNVNALIDAAAIYDKNTEEPSLLDYLQQIALFSDTDSYDNAQDRVALMTLHAAKGLEFDNVFIVGLEQGLLPHERSVEDENEIEEERRLFFVGITRAKCRLYISHARYRTYRSQLTRTIPSQFLFELGIKPEEKTEESNNHENEDIKYDFEDGHHDEFYPNQLVRHNKFGLGRITQFTDLGENSTVTVRFNSGKTKTLMLKYAKLETVDI